MKKIIATLLFILTACTTNAPIVESTSTSLPATSQAIPTSTIEIISPTVPPTNEAAPTAELINQRTSPVDGMPQVYIPAGTFHMGGLDVRRAPNEIPDHEVQLSAYWMDQLEVTNAMYALCMNTGACDPPQSFRSQRRADYFENIEFKDYPVVYVTWGQAKAYCEWVGRRLPTEAEWERAARGDDFRTFPWGEDKADGLLTNFNMLVGDTSRVGTYPLGASPFGVLDMAGNVAEWVNDFYSFNYSVSDTVVNPTGPESSGSFSRVVRGGSLGDAEINIRVSKRSSVTGPNPNAAPGSSAYLGDFSPRIGFRCTADD
jgi:formylglycine-generating enzyme required for sulfatase activity